MRMILRRQGNNAAFVADTLRRYDSMRLGDLGQLLQVLRRVEAIRPLGLVLLNKSVSVLRIHRSK